MKNTIFIVAGLLSVVALCSCDKDGKSEQEQEEQTYEWEPATKGEAGEDVAEKEEDEEWMERTKLGFPENELLFGKEGGEKTIACPEWWGYWWLPENFRDPDMLGSLPPGTLSRLPDGIQRLETALFKWTAGKLIVPEGWRTEEVAGNLPTLISPRVPAGSSLYSNGSPGFYYTDLWEYEEYAYVGDEGWDPMGFVTLLDGGWFTASREIADWYEPYEGFAYRNETFKIRILDENEEVCGYQERDHPARGAFGKWWIPKECSDREGNYAVTIRVAPNDTGQTGRFYCEGRSLKTTVYNMN